MDIANRVNAEATANNPFFRALKKQNNTNREKPKIPCINVKYEAQLKKESPSDEIPINSLAPNKSISKG